MLLEESGKASLKFLQKMAATLPLHLLHLLKKRVLAACGLAASYEGRISEQEMVIIRLFADSMGCPVPNLSTGKN